MTSVMLDKNGQRVQILAEKLQYLFTLPTWNTFPVLRSLISDDWLWGKNWRSEQFCTVSGFRQTSVKNAQKKSWRILWLWKIYGSETDDCYPVRQKLWVDSLVTEEIQWQYSWAMGIKSDCISFISCISLTLPFVFLSAWQQWKSSSSDNTAEHQIKLLSVELYTLVWSPCYEATFRFYGNYDIFVLHHVWAHVTILININSEEHQRSTQRSWKGSWISLQDQFMFCGVISSPI